MTLNDNFRKLDELSERLLTESRNYELFLEFIALYEDCNDLLSSMEHDVKECRDKLESYWGINEKK